MITEEVAFNRLASYCVSTERCKFDLIDKMKRWELSEDVIERIIIKLEKENFINEERFCRAFINDKFRFTKWGKKKIAQALYFKKISQSVIYQYLDEIDQDEYIALLTDLLNSKRKNIRAKDEFELNGKLIRFALSRGFEFDDIKYCITDSDYQE